MTHCWPCGPAPCVGECQSVGDPHLGEPGYVACDTCGWYVPEVEMIICGECGVITCSAMCLPALGRCHPADCEGDE